MIGGWSGNAGRWRSPRTILITGASSGIGRALALEYAAPRCFLALGGRNRERLGEVAGACKAKGASVSIGAVDVADRVAMERWVEDIDECHPLDLVVANAGISAPSGTDRDLEESTRDVFVVNLAGMLNTVLPILPRMAERGRGQIALMSSLAGLRGLPSAPAYSASKVAVRAYGEALRARTSRDGVAVSVICPGFVRTPMTDGNGFPMPLLMEPEEAARIIREGLARNKARIAFPWLLHAAMRVMAALPPLLVDPLLRALPRKE